MEKSLDYSNMESWYIIPLILIVILQVVILAMLLRGKNDRVEADIKRLREELGNNDKNIREEISSGFFRVNESTATQSNTMFNQMSHMMKDNGEQQERIRQVVETSLKDIRVTNELKLDEMRKTVDEKLDATLAARLDGSFKQVSERLETLYKSIGEMQSLSTGVTDLNRMLNNQKVRGIWGEAQLENILMSMLSTNQYDKNVITKKGSQDRVEFAIKIPIDDEGQAFIYLPIDSKNPASYEAIISASENNDMEALTISKKELETRIKLEARSISEKYLSTATTDFAIMFLPSEALYSEVIRLNDIAAYAQEKYHVMIAGPTTLTSLISSISVGFRAININIKSKEIIKTLQAVKTQYETFVELLSKSQKKIQEASKSVDMAANRALQINKKLNKIEELDMSESELFLDMKEE